MVFKCSPVADVVLLQVLLGQVLEVALGHGNVSSDGDLGLLTSDLDVVTQSTGLWMGRTMQLS